MLTRRSRGIEIMYARSSVTGTCTMMIVSDRAPMPGFLARWSDPTRRKLSGPESDVSPRRAPGAMRRSWCNAALYRAVRIFSAAIKPPEPRAKIAPSTIEITAQSGVRFLGWVGAGVAAVLHPLSPTLHVDGGHKSGLALRRRRAPKS